MCVQKGRGFSSLVAWWQNCLFCFFNSFYCWVYRLGIAVLPTAPTTVLLLQVLWGVCMLSGLNYTDPGINIPVCLMR